MSRENRPRNASNIVGVDPSGEMSGERAAAGPKHMSTGQLRDSMARPGSIPAPSGHSLPQRRHGLWSPSSAGGGYVRRAPPGARPRRSGTSPLVSARRGTSPLVSARRGTSPLVSARRGTSPLVSARRGTSPLVSARYAWPGSWARRSASPAAVERAGSCHPMQGWVRRHAANAIHATHAQGDCLATCGHPVRPRSVRA